MFPRPQTALLLSAIAASIGCGLSSSEPEVGTDAIGADPTAGDMVLETTIPVAAVDGCTQLYSPTVLADAHTPGLFHMWYGGWATCSDRDQYGNDRIYHSTSSDLRNWTPPQAVVSSASYHFNDPSVIQISYPINGVPTPLYVMYMTGCSTAADCFTTGHNITYGSTSFDGVTWSVPQEVVGVNNGLNQGGAWSPCALKVSDDLVYLYYFVNTGDPATEGQVQRATIHPQAGFFAAGMPEVVVGSYHANANVAHTSRGFEMLYDSGSPFQINRLLSSDGLHFSADPTFPTIDGAPDYSALTAHEFPVPGTPNEYWLYFGWGKANATYSVAGWRLQRN